MARRRLGVGAAGLLLLLGGVLFLLSGRGAAASIETLLRLAFHPESVRLERVEGNLLAGGRLIGLVLAGPVFLPDGRISVESVALASAADLLRRPGEPAARAAGIRITAPGFDGLAERAVMTLPRRLVVEQVQTSGLPGVPEATGRMERAEFTLPFRPDRVRRIERGQLTLSSSDPILFSLPEGRGSPLDLFSSGLDIEEIGRILFPKVSGRRPGGLLREVRFKVNPPFEEPGFHGTARIELFRLKDFSVTGARAAFEGRLVESGSGRRVLAGSLQVEGGELSARGTVVRLDRMRLQYDGSGGSPRLNLAAESLVGGVHISIGVQGTLERPEIRLSSDPPKREEQLLLMLATGRRWEAVELAVSEGKISPALAEDFLEYFIFGRVDDQLADRFKTVGFTPTLDLQTGATGGQVRIGEKVRAGYELTPARTEALDRPAQEWKEKVGVAYDLGQEQTVEMAGEKRQTGGGDISVKYKRKF